MALPLAMRIRQTRAIATFADAQMFKIQNDFDFFSATLKQQQ
jgi:hypothetical protein